MRRWIASRMKGRTASYAGALLLVLAAACARQTRPLIAGDDACERCRMTISDPRFGGEVITRHGRLRTFDSAECLASYVVAAGDSLDKAKIYVADYESSEMVPVATAHFLRGGKLHSPMGRELVAFAATHDPRSLINQYGGELLSWGQLLGDAAATQSVPAAAADSISHPPTTHSDR